MKANYRPVYGWYVVALMSALYLVSFIDRVVLNLLVGPLKAEFQVSDTQLSLLQGVGFALCYGIVGVPLARMADLGNRKFLIFGGVLLWSVSTLGSAFATGFGMLVVLRMGLAIGEAALSPAALSMFADMFPSRQRSLAGSIYIATGLGGSFAAFIIASGVVAWLGTGTEIRMPMLGELKLWQAVFVIVGLPGLMLALVLLFTVSEPARNATDDNNRPTSGDVLAEFRQRWRLYASVALAGGLISNVVSSLPAWVPSLLIRNHQYSIQEAGVAFGSVGLIAGVAGTVGLPRLAANLDNRGRVDGFALAGIVAVTLGAPAVLCVAYASTPTVLMGALGASVFCWFGAVALPILAVQHIAPPRMRATFTALLLLIQAVLGFSVGPTATAALSNHVFGGEQGLGFALATVAWVVAPAAAFLLWVASKSLMPPAEAAQGRSALEG